MQSQVIVKRYPYEEPYHTQIEFIVSNGGFSGNTDIYCNVEDLKEIGEALQNFPNKIDDLYIYEYSSEKVEDRFYRHFWLKVYTVGSLGYCAIQFHINKNTEELEEGICRFSILGKLPQSMNWENYLKNFPS
jgi:hypothetical protein